MTSAARSQPPAIPPLRHGERLTQAEFHRRYEAYPDDVKAELIGGIVYMASPLERPHASYHSYLGGAFWLYAGGTPGVESLDNVTTILDEEAEPQPDLTLRVLAEYGGRSSENPQQYVQGPPELLAQIADSTVNLDLNQRRRDYQRTEVLEYVVLSIPTQELRWFDFERQQEIRPNRRGIARSRVFPGLRIDVPALFARDDARLIAAVQEGLASREHAAFVRRLEAARRKHT
jgi:hypothetical protein